MRTILLALILCAPAFSQDKLVQEGILDHFDKERRGPVLTVSAKRVGDAGQILADAYIPYEDLNKFPIRFDFYVNGELFSSQLRTPELNRAVGITVPRERATLPFNYQVIATLLTPNRVYPTVIQGAIFETDLSAKLSCSVRIESPDLEEKNMEYEATRVELTQSSSSSVSFNFTANSDKGSVDLAGSLSVEGTSLSGNITTTQNGETLSRTVTGSLSRDRDRISSLNVTSENFELDCAGLVDAQEAALEENP
jgi:hypothetical protein